MPHEEILIAPENFTMVEPGVYRSAFPRTKNMGFLDYLELKSVVSLVLEDYPLQLVEFYKRNNIELITMGVEGNKGAFKGIHLDTFYEVMKVIMNNKKRPLLIHCNKGKHRTGCVVGCLRRLRGWSISCIVDEYIMMASPKPRLEDQRFIEAFQVDEFNYYQGLEGIIKIKNKDKNKDKKEKEKEKEKGNERDREGGNENSSSTSIPTPTPILTAMPTTRQRTVSFEDNSKTE